jgi:hypothetical protein
MKKRIYVLALVSALLGSGGVASAQQFPVLDEIANKVVQKCQNSSCDQLWQQRGEPKPQREQKAIRILRNNPQMRAVFIERVAAPIVNKMFECGLLP